mmetsp:Transcript_26166/g.57173  ORF Transcript_26166/g.57173 Transcript_26166/m.57173 type:complete len:113 (-) Transcript_26166:725-1063(-)
MWVVLARLGMGLKATEQLRLDAGDDALDTRLLQDVAGELGAPLCDACSVGHAQPPADPASLATRFCLATGSIKELQADMPWRQDALTLDGAEGADTGLTCGIASVTAVHAFS